MRRMGRQLGEGKIGCLFWSLLGLLFIVVGVKVVPIKMATMQLEDRMKELAMTQPRRSKGFFEREIHNRARDLDLPVARKQIRVKKYKERVIMDVEFMVPVEIFTYTYDWNIKIHVDRDLFLM